MLKKILEKKVIKIILFTLMFTVGSLSFAVDKVKIEYFGKVFRAAFK